MGKRTIVLAGTLGVLAFACGALIDGVQHRPAIAGEPAPITIPLDPETGGAAPILAGSSIARSPGGARTYIADEPTSSIYVAKTTDVGKTTPLPSLRLLLPQSPAQLVAFGDHVLVTLRSPGMLVSYRPDAAAALVEEWRVALPDDAWGLAVTEDHTTAIVTSAWTHHVTAVDLPTHSVRWSVDVGREPRGIALRPEGTIAYVSHLTSGKITTLEKIDGPKPIVRAIELPVAPLLAGPAPAEGTLGWALALSPDGTRVFAPRQALGDIGDWNGTMTVDVLRTPLDAPLAVMGKSTVVGKPSNTDEWAPAMPTEGPAMGIGRAFGLAVPRAIAVRAKTRTLLVAAEGTANLVELDARALAPALHPLHRYPLEGCSAPSGVTLSPDESVAFVQCTASFAVHRVVLRGAFQYELTDHEWQPEPIVTSSSTYASDPLGTAGALGRRLFSDAVDQDVSGGFPCSGCHPEGRDDGHVWSEVGTSKATVSGYQGVESLQPRVLTARPSLANTKGVARQTPMLAGRLEAPGPYGWRGESPTLAARIENGMKLHRWFRMWGPETPLTDEAHGKAAALVAFVRAGLVPPPVKKEGTLSAAEERGRTVFDLAQCSTCHETKGGARPLVFHLDGGAIQTAFEPEPKASFKVPNLQFIGGTAPYFHDGSAQTLEELIEKNDDRMGLTNQLSADDRAALIAYMRTL